MDIKETVKTPEEIVQQYIEFAENYKETEMSEEEKAIRDMDWTLLELCTSNIVILAQLYGEGNKTLSKAKQVIIPSNVPSRKPENMEEAIEFKEKLELPVSFTKADIIGSAKNDTIIGMVVVIVCGKTILASNRVEFEQPEQPISYEPLNLFYEYKEPYIHMAAINKFNK